MNVDEMLSSLRTLPRPTLSPFFVARIGQKIQTEERVSIRTPIVLRVYWLVLAFCAGVVLLQSWAGVAMIVAALAFAALTPAGVLTPTTSRRTASNHDHFRGVTLQFGRMKVAPRVGFEPTTK